MEECLKKQVDLQQALDVAKKETENERENSKKARMEWEREREAMKEEISELRDNLRYNYDLLKKMEGKHKVWMSHASLILFNTIFFNLQTELNFMES